MSDDACRPNEARIDPDDDERRRARLHAARSRGGTCAGCGRALAAGEPVWWARFALRGAYGSVSHQGAPVGREWAPGEFLRETGAAGPEPCLGCGRGVHYGSASRPRGLVFCSTRCAGRYQTTRAKEARGS